MISASKQERSKGLRALTIVSGTTNKPVTRQPSLQAGFSMKPLNHQNELVSVEDSALTPFCENGLSTAPECRENKDNPGSRHTVMQAGSSPPNQSKDQPSPIWLALSKAAKQFDTTCRTKSSMKALVIASLVITIILLAVVIALQMLKVSEEEELSSNGDKKQQTIYEKLMKPLIDLSPCTTVTCTEDEQASLDQNGKQFQRVNRGQVNYIKRASITMHSFPVRGNNNNNNNKGPIMGTASGFIAKYLLDDNKTAAILDQDQQKNINHPNEPYVSDLDQVKSSLDNNSDAITIDKIKGIDWDESRMIKQKSESPKQQNRVVKCTNNKYDRLIAQKISMNDLSRPIVQSDGRFDNPFASWNKQSLFDALKFLIFEPNESNVPKNKTELDIELPVLKPDFDVNKSSTNPGDFRVTWIGHATLLIQVDGFNILTDPVFSDRASPTQYVGPKRIREPACDVKSLPQIDIVLISHNHYDHLDTNSVKDINERFGNKCRWIVPLGVGEYMQSMDVENFVELDWWQKDCFHVGYSPATTKPINIKNKPKVVTSRTSSYAIPVEQTSRATRSNRIELDVYLTPTQHWSRRGLNDMNKSLWGSFTIVSGSGSTFFFTGDSAYCSAFKEIGKIFGPFTGAAIPIGAYNPRWFLKNSHVDPMEAVQIHRDLKSNKSIAIHHSTFILSNEDYKEPPRFLRETMDSLKLKEPFTTIKHGETTQFCKAC